MTRKTPSQLEEIIDRYGIGFDKEYDAFVLGGEHIRDKELAAYIWVKEDDLDIRITDLNRLVALRRYRVERSALPSAGEA